MKKIIILAICLIGINAAYAQTTPFLLSGPMNSLVTLQDPYGNVGIGATSTPPYSAALDVANIGQTSTPPIVTLIANQTAVSGNPLAPGRSSFSFGVERLDYSLLDPQADLSVDNTGLVGIGDVSASHNSSHLFIIDPQNDGNPLLTVNTATGATPSNYNALTVIANANVGVGVATPQATLDISRPYLHNLAIPIGLEVINNDLSASGSGTAIGANVVVNNASPYNYGGQFTVSGGSGNVGVNTIINGSNATTGNGGLVTTINGTGAYINSGVVSIVSGDNTNQGNYGGQFFVSGNSTAANVGNTGMAVNVTGNNTGSSGYDAGIQVNVSGNVARSWALGGTSASTGQNVGVNGIACGANGSYGNAGVSGLAYGSEYNTGINGFVTTDSNSSSTNTAVYGSFGVGSDGLQNFGIWGDLTNLAPSSNTVPYYAIYGTVPGYTTSSSSVSPGTPTSNPYLTYAGYFEGDVFCSNNFYYSDPKLKENITIYSGALDQLSKLPVKRYTFKNKEYPKMNLPLGNQIGVLSTDLKAVFPNLVKGGMHPGNKKTGEKDVTFDAVNYTALIPVLIEAVQELRAKTDSMTILKAALDNTNNALNATNATVAALQKQIDDLCNGGCVSLQGNSANTDPAAQPGNKLLQNVPNPFSLQTTIGYVLNTGTTAYMNINGLDGKLIEQVPLTINGAGSITINSNEMASGTYTYSLYVDGNTVDTKLMVIISK